MQLSTFTFHSDHGWSVPEFPALDSPQTLVMVYGAPEYVDHHAPIHQLLQAYPQSIVVGCSSAGEISGRQVNDASLSVAVARFEHTRLTVVSSTIDKVESAAVGEQLARQLLRAGEDLRSVLILSEGMNVSGSALAQGMSAVLPPQVVVSGGLAGDGRRFERTWVLCNGLPQASQAVAIGLYGKRLHVGFGSSGGWDVFGPERVITRAAGNVLYELDGKPALALYKEYLGEYADGLPGTGLFFPLAIWKPEPGARKVMRCMASIDEAAQSITFGGDVPQGYYAQLSKANFDNLVTAAHEAADLTTNGRQTAPVLALAVSCVGRRIMMGERSDEELSVTLDNLPPGSLQVGFYSYGEIGPFPGQTCTLYNQTMTLTTFCEE
ncbi:MAG: hypothetical protein EPO06_10640 [Burkholderiaceae bacterium]|nr:MAG: hypothetical protein EPO06_10640 [Burkholderiaceae bacterium]